MEKTKTDKPITLYVLFLLTITGCSYSVTSHQFMYHGTDFPQTDKDFFYVEEGIFGSASANYTIRGGGHVREGLVADAKTDMKIGHPLEKNQAYANLSIDVMETVSGRRWGDSRDMRRIELTAVVTADIIEFGNASEKNSNSAKGSGSIGSAIKATEKKSSGNPSQEFEIGDEVMIDFGGRLRQAIIISVEWKPLDNQFSYKVEYETNSGSIRTTTRLEDRIF